MNERIAATDMNKIWEVASSMQRRFRTWSDEIPCDFYLAMIASLDRIKEIAK